MKRLIVAFLFLLIFVCLKARGLYEGHVLVRLNFKNPEKLKRFLNVFPKDDLDIWTHDGEIVLGHDMEILFKPKQFELLKKFMNKEASEENTFEVIVPNIQESIDEEKRRILEYEVMMAAKLAHVQSEEEAKKIRFGDDYWKSYHPLERLYEFDDELARRFPDRVERRTIGKSIEGREIRLTVIHAPGKFDQSKPALFISAMQHAREWISPPVVQYAAQKIVEGYDTNVQIRDLLNDVNVFVVTCVNPDGYHHTWQGSRMWRKNRRGEGGNIYGVDLNRNWKSGFGGSGSSGSKSSETYRGTHAYSEPETKALAEFFAANPQIKFGIDFHSYSELVLRPWGKTNQVSPDEPRLSKIGQEIVDGIASVHGKKYSNIRASQLYLASGIISDDFYETFKMFGGYTIELRPGRFGGGGFILPPEQIIPTVEENWQAVLVGLKYTAQFAKKHYCNPN